MISFRSYISSTNKRFNIWIPNIRHDSPVAICESEKGFTINKLNPGTGNYSDGEVLFGPFRTFDIVKVVYSLNF